MSRKFLFIGLALLISVNVLCASDLRAARAAAPLSEKTLVLYDASSGDIPDSSAIGFTAFPPDGAALRYDEGSTVLDTTVSGTDTYAGLVASAATTDGFPILDSTIGFHVNFTIQVESESHESSNRSGFSIIILDSNSQGIELAFWTNEIWVQSDDSTGGLFTHSEGVAFDTTAALIDYQVTMLGDTYTLTANSQPVLTGPIRNYSAFDRFPDPYETPNFLFLGDDTTSAQARVRLRFLSATGTEPVTPTSAVTTTSTSLPQPTVTNFPSSTPVPAPSPTPGGGVTNLCPSGWLLLIGMIGNVLLANKIKLFSRRL